MRTTRLGRTGLSVSRVGFGAIPIQRLSDAQAIEVVQGCLDLGVTLLDAANSYTTSEERIGKAIAGRRDQVILATKTMARDKVTARAHLELSLRRLGTEVIDLWQFHNVSTFEAYEQVLAPGGAMEAAREALQAGLVKHIGISSHSLDMARVAVSSGLFETIQFPFNFITCEPEEELLPLAAEHDVGFIAMKPFAGGMLDDANLAIKYLLQFDGVVPDPGIETVEEMEEIAAIVSGPAELTPHEQEQIALMRAEVGTRFCRRCGYCQPCPQEVNISMALNLASFWKRFPPERMVSGWLAEVAEGGRNCIQCGECEEKCPYHLPIREMLTESLDFYDRTVLGRTA
ncbi:MAG TPA: aldo/keto reductase [Anaerolineae bacterium]|nr:aldo/keto reductase [Anaerolineae bacterium]